MSSFSYMNTSIGFASFHIIEPRKLDPFILLHLGTQEPIMKLSNLVLGFAAIAAMAVND
jgi:hypothetical protein